MEQRMESSLPDCLRQQPQQCREIQINAKVPLDWALPLYGFLMPLVVAVTVLTNSFIVVVLSHRSLRTPTNFVLGAMAISELLTGLVCLPWLLYYYTFRGFETDQEQGLSPFWCSLFPYLATILPSIFHTSAIWLTVYLAVQRFIYICWPKHVRSHCTIHRSKQVIVCICVGSVWIYAPELFASYNQSFLATDPRTNRTRSLCLMSRTVLIQMVGNNLYHLLLYGLHTILVHTLPCVLLVFFTWKLIAAIRKADKKHSYLVGRTHQQQRKFTTAGIIAPDGAVVVVENGGGGTGTGRYSMDEGAQWSVVEQQSGSGGEKTPASRGSISESKRVQGLKQNTRMLLAVILLFLLTEIPAALIFSVHVGTVALKFTFIINHYAVLNKLLIVRNVLIVISYPLRFAIYCGMSAQFREVVQQMLSKRRKFLFFFSLHFPYGKLGTAKGEGTASGGGMDGGGTTTGSPTGQRKRPTAATSAVLQKSSIVWRGGDSRGPLLLGGSGGSRVDRRPTTTTTTMLAADERELSGGIGTVPAVEIDNDERKIDDAEPMDGSAANFEEEEEDEFGECRL